MAKKRESIYEPKVKFEDTFKDIIVLFLQRGRKVKESKGKTIRYAAYNWDNKILYFFYFSLELY
jgi:hypothetical protein